MKIKALVYIFFTFLSFLPKVCALTIAIPPLCPYFCPQNASQGGYLPYILQQSLSPEKVKIVSVPEGRLKKGLLGGDYDFVVLPSFEIIRESNLFVSSPALGIHFLGKASLESRLVNIPMREVKNKILTIIKENALTKYLDNKLQKLPHWKTNQIIYISGSEISKRMVKMLKLKRADIIISDFNALSYEISKEGGKANIHLRPSSLSGFSPLVLVSKNQKNKKVYNKIYRWIRRSRQSGRLKKLLRTYNLDDWDIYNTRL